MFFHIHHVTKPPAVAFSDSKPRTHNSALGLGCDRACFSKNIFSSKNGRNWCASYLPSNPTSQVASLELKQWTPNPNEIVCLAPVAATVTVTLGFQYILLLRAQKKGAHKPRQEDLFNFRILDTSESRSELITKTSGKPHHIHWCKHFENECSQINMLQVEGLLRKPNEIPSKQKTSNILVMLANNQ